MTPHIIRKSFKNPCPTNFSLALNKLKIKNLDIYSKETESLLQTLNIVNNSDNFSLSASLTVK